MTRTDRGGVPIVALPFLLVGIGGLALALYTSFLLLRGPFFPGPRLESVEVLYAAGGFVAGTILTAWGGTRASRLW